MDSLPERHDVELTLISITLFEIRYNNPQADVGNNRNTYSKNNKYKSFNVVYDLIFNLLRIDSFLS